MEARLQHEIVKVNPGLGTNLDVLPTAQLQQLVQSQEEALKRARAMLVCTSDPSLQHLLWAYWDWELTGLVQVVLDEETPHAFCSTYDLCAAY